LFGSYYGKDSDQARTISELKAIFEKKGNSTINAFHDWEEAFTSEEWKGRFEQANDVWVIGVHP
jgi:hypothetical protein